MSDKTNGDVSAFVQTAEHQGGYVWVLTLVDFAARDVKRSLVSEETYATSAAARDAGLDRLQGMAGDA
ncbi:hypothetical protein [Trinickia soli]|jgi:hypothetical protein|uniref:Uncharacterized protein n=1 Tax=Trinickia soli TaxID=380675 RepID=A0A2N7W4M5_9BURK|nr:hypothetical protein [Trinickia soli]PMS24343.1 hypothetical protein C0Z19_13810 [Trinickia soli]CAB3675034.1 hypothetical protein LMG24076_02123 [Trinickia soli]